MTPNFEEILLELSYRIPQGIVDLTNKEHLDELVIILEERGIYNSQAINALKEKAKKSPKVKTLRKINPNQSKRQKDLDNILKQTFQNPDTKRMVTVATALGYEDDFPKAFNIAKSKFKAAGFTNKDIDMVDVGPGDKEKPAPKQNIFPTAGGKKNQTKKAGGIKVSDAEKRAEEPTTTTTKGGSFKDAYLSNSKAKNPQKAEEDLQKRLQQSLSQIDKAASYNSDKQGFFELETEEGSGEFIKIKTEDVKIAVTKLFNGEKLSANDKKNLNLTTKIVTNPENGDVKLYFAKKIAGRHPQQGYESVLMAEKNVPMGDAIRKYAIDNGLKIGKSSEGAIGKKQTNPAKNARAINPDEPVKNIKVKSDKNGLDIEGKIYRYKSIPDEKEVIKAYVKLGKNLDEAKEKARIFVNERKSFNQKIDTILTAAEKSGGQIDYCNFGDVFTAEGRKETITNVVKGITKSFTDDLKKYQKTFGTEDLTKTPENQAVFNTLKKLEKLSTQTDLQSDKESRKAFKGLLNQLLIDMDNSIDFRDAKADFAEMVVGLEELSKGRKVLFPSAENFQTADIIVLPNDEDIKNSNSITDFQLLNVSIEELDLLGGVSIKSDGGGGSALKNRIEQTEYKNKKTQQKLLNALGTYQIAYGNQQNVNEKELANAESMIEDLFEYGISIGAFDEKQKEIIKKIGTKAGLSEIKTAGKAGNCGGEENQKRLHRAIILQHIQMQLTCIIGNFDTDYTNYANVNKKMGKKKGRVVNVQDDIADGIKKPCYSTPHHNPGYTKSVDKNGCVSITPTNQNPAHIKSSMPDLINNYKEES